MGRLFQKYENLILLICLLIFAGILLSNNAQEDRQPNLLERAIIGVVTPFQNMATGAVHSVIGGYYHYFYLVNADDENKKLKELFHEQMFKNNQLREELKKYRRVDEMLTYSPVSLDRAVVATAASWDATNIARTVVVNRGSEQGVREGMVALTHLGLVGRVVTAAPNASRVLLITDARSAVDCYVQRTRTRCLVVGQNRRRCELLYLPVNADVKDGDLLVSTGLGGIYPPGVPVGRVTNLDAGASKLFYKAELIPTANLDRLEEMLVADAPPAMPEELVTEAPPKKKK